MSTVTCIRRPRSTWTRCRCDTCLPGQNRLRKLARSGVYSSAPSDAAWEAIEAKLADDWTPNAIASAAGLTLEAVRKHVQVFQRTGHQAKLGHGVADAILGAGRPTVGSVGAYGSMLRLRALARIGYDLNTLAREAGVSRATLQAIRGGERQRVRVRHASSIAEAFDRLQHTPGPNETARRLAAGKGWMGPYQYDPEDFVTPVKRCLRGHRMLIESDVYRPPSHPQWPDCRICKTERGRAA